MPASSYKSRRTFCIISHPDAGKTTLTEKLLLFGGAIRMAGTVKARKAERHATSDWMEIEKQRGISVTSSVLQFPFAGRYLNLLDTPGHHDFSEDTYRVLTAVDAALMVIDGAKGIEPQTRKLMEICRDRKIPVITFVNKLDRECKSPFELLDEIENDLGLKTTPRTLPLSSGKSFRGVYHLHNKNFAHFKAGMDQEEILETTGLEDDRWSEWIDETLLDDLKENADLAEGVYESFDREAYLNGNLTPVFYGTALNSVGIELMLREFCEIAPEPQPRFTNDKIVEPGDHEFSGFVFKIQANMDPRHRDRMAFLRICSGAFEKNKQVLHVRNDRKMRIGNTFQFMASERASVEEAFAGDIVGIYDTGEFKIGDTITEKSKIQFLGIPNFAPELFKRVVLKDPLKSKQLRKGLQQLCEEGASQVFYPMNNNDIYVGVVGQLQFEVIQHRLEAEYGAHAKYDASPYRIARWVVPNAGKEGQFQKTLDQLASSYDTVLSKDAEDRYAILCSSDYALRKAEERFPDVTFQKTSEAAARL